MRPRRLLQVSVAVALLTIVLKTLAWWLTGSVGLLADAMESFVNLAGAMFGLAMVTVAALPPDEEHPFGHHKAEYFSSGFEGILIIGAAAGMVWAAAGRWFEPQPLEQLGWGLGLSVVSSALNGALAWAMIRAAREHQSAALHGDARHLITDVWTSAGVVLGLLLASATGWLWLDPLVAIGVALNIVREGAHLVWRASQGLMDEALEPALRARIDEVLARFEGADVHFDHLKTRHAGQSRFLDIHLYVPEDWTLGRAAALRASVEQGLIEAVPGLRASIQLLPRDAQANPASERA
jgi:cation diffusion facilitator family transporter